MIESVEHGEPITEFDDRFWLTVVGAVTVYWDTG